MEMLVGLSLILTFTATSEAFFAPRVINTFKDAAEKIQVLNFAQNTSDVSKTKESKFKDQPMKEDTIKEYDHELNSTTNNISFNSGLNGKYVNVMVLARIGDYDNIGKEAVEWTKLSDIEDYNNSTKQRFGRTGREGILNGSLYNDFQQIINDNREIYYTFKDFVKIGIDSKIKDKLTNNKPPTLAGSKKFNVTYIMPIEKTKKYFEVKITNLTDMQYKEINELLQKYMQRKSNGLNLSSDYDARLYVDTDEKKQVTSRRALTESTSSPDWSNLQKKLTQNGEPGISWPIKPEEAATFINRVFTEEGYIDFFNEFSANLGNESHNDSVPFSNPQSMLIKNNGFHAPVVTDYIHTYKNVSSLENNHNLGTTPSSQSWPEYDLTVGTSTTILNPIYVSLSHSSSKRPIKFLSNITRDRGRTTITDQDKFIRENIMLPQENNLSDIESIIHSSNITLQNKTFDRESLIGTSNVGFSNLTENQPFVHKQVNAVQKDINKPMNITNWFSLFKKYHNLTNSKENEMTNVMEAAQWILQIKNDIEVEKTRKREYLQNYIRKYLVGEDNTFLSRGGGNSTVMKINRQENILDELKHLMLGYFKTMGFNEKFNYSSSAKDIILSSNNIFELLDYSSQLLKLNLESKVQIKTEEPVALAKKIVESQIEKCKQFVSRTWINKSDHQFPEKIKNNNLKFLMLTKCMQYKFKKCILKFRMWLEKRKYYLTPKFKLDRVYEMYEIENNLYCLRIYNPTYLDSNLHGTRMKPQSKLNRHLGLKRLRTMNSRNRLRMRRIKNVRRIKSNLRKNNNLERGKDLKNKVD